MLQLLKHEKDGGGEDQKTSSILENFLLLPDGIVWEILRSSMLANVDSELPKFAGNLVDFDFWPHWDAKGTKNKVYVEPDVFFEV